MEVIFDARQTMIVAILVLFIGKYLNRTVSVLRQYNIPEPVTGGLLMSMLFSGAYFVAGLDIRFTLEPRDTLLIVFFTGIGLSSRLATLVSGGGAILLLLVMTTLILLLQNLVGVGVIALTGLDHSIGILGGSVALTGGHGTAIAWAPLFVEQFGVRNALEIGIACATFGLVLGGVVGGPLAGYLIRRYQLRSSSHEALVVGMPEQNGHDKITVDSVLNALLVFGFAVGLGIELNAVLAALGLKLPMFVTCLFAGIVLTNTVPVFFKRVTWPTGTATLALISDLSLGLFLAMSLMSLQLWTLLDLAGPILLLLLAQVTMVLVFVRFVLFPLLGSHYEAAVMCAGATGLVLGATPTAIANMTSVTERHGAAPRAFLLIPLVGAFFIDIVNAFVINLMLGWLR